MGEPHNNTMMGKAVCKAKNVKFCPVEGVGKCFDEYLVLG